MDTQTLPKPGQRIECVYMGGDPNPIPVGSRGTVLKVQEIVPGDHHIDVAWDSGRTLGLLSLIDRYRIL
jgi:hypothetical protein